MRRTWWTLLAVGLAGLLGACSPKGTPLVAVGLDAQGIPIGIVAACDGDGVIYLSAFENDKGGNRVWRVTGLGHPLGSGEVKLLTVPSGWSAEETTLTGLAEDRAYAFSAGLSSGRDVDAVTFRLADLRGLGAGQVWGYQQAGDTNPQALSRKDFEKEAANSCG